jgi:hypothetical protein
VLVVLIGQKRSTTCTCRSARRRCSGELIATANSLMPIRTAVCRAVGERGDVRALTHVSGARPVPTEPGVAHGVRVAGSHLGRQPELRHAKNPRRADGGGGGLTALRCARSPFPCSSRCSRRRCAPSASTPGIRSPCDPRSPGSAPG